MRIGIDAKELFTSPQLCRAVRRLAEDFPDSEFYLYTAKEFKLSKGRAGGATGNDLLALKDYHNVRVCLPAPSGFGGELWRLFGITNCLEPDKVDIFHGIGGILPLNIAGAGVATVASIDRTVLSQAMQGGIAGKWRRYKCREACRNATVVMAPDEETKRRIVENFVISPDKIIIAPAGGTATEESGRIMETYRRAIALKEAAAIKKENKKQK